MSVTAQPPGQRQCQIVQVVYVVVGDQQGVQRRDFIRGERGRKGTGGQAAFQPGARAEPGVGQKGHSVQFHAHGHVTDEGEAHGGPPLICEEVPKNGNKFH